MLAHSLESIVTVLKHHTAKECARSVEGFVRQGVLMRTADLRWTNDDGRVLPRDLSDEALYMPNKS